MAEPRADRAPLAYALPTYPFVPPPDLKARETATHPVVVVGAGLTGLTLACRLAQLRVPTVLLDEDNTVGVKGASSRGICYTQKSLEIFQRYGIYERIAAKARLVLREAEELGDMARAAGRPLSGEMRMSVIPTIAPFLLPRVLPLLRRDYPDLKLFLREKKSLTLTDPGRVYLEVVRDCFDRLAAGTAHLLQRENAGVLTVSMSPNFGRR